MVWRECDDLSESYWTVISCSIVDYVVQGCSKFWVCGLNPMVWPFKWKLTEQYFPVALLIMLYKVLNFWVCGWNPMVWPFKWKPLSSAFLWYCLLCRTRWFKFFESVDEILWCDHSNESHWAVLSCDIVYYAVQGGSKFLSLWMKYYGVTIQMKATEQYFPEVLFIMLYKVVLKFLIQWIKSYVVAFQM